MCFDQFVWLNLRSKKKVDRTKRGIAHFPLHADVLNSAVLAKLFAAHSSYLLPQAFPEGSPLHPSYPAGHATVAGACKREFFPPFLRNCV